MERGRCCSGGEDLSLRGDRSCAEDRGRCTPAVSGGKGVERCSVSKIPSDSRTTHSFIALRIILVK